MNDQPHPVPGLGLWTLYRKEVQRFLKVAGQTLGAPLITALLFLAIFTLALGRAVEVVNGVPFTTFLAPGLVMMTVTQNAFANSSSSLMISKIQGNIVDMLMPPLSAHELTAGLVLGAMTRGVIVGLLTLIAMAFWVEIPMAHPWLIAVYLLLGSILMGLLGVLTGLWATKFDQLAVVTNFVITPLAFLSGTFYSVQRLPDIWYAISQVNPFFYLIDGFRFAAVGVSDASPWTGIAVLIALIAGLWAITVALIARGYKIKA